MSGGDTFDKFNERADRGRFGDNESAPIGGNAGARSDLVDLRLRLMHDTTRAIAVVDPEKFGKVPWTWLPKSKVEFIDKGGGLVEVTLPRWLAKEKELI